MRVRVLHAKLYAYALPGSAARQLFISSTLLDSSTATRQTSTDLDRTRRPGTWSQARQARQELDRLDRQGLDSASTVPRRSLDSSTARQPGLKLQRGSGARGPGLRACGDRGPRAVSHPRGFRNRVGIIICCKYTFAPPSPHASPTFSANLTIGPIDSEYTSRALSWMPQLRLG